MAADKAIRRSELARFRQSLGAEEHARRSERIITRLKELPEVSRARSVHVYWPIAGRNEVDTRPLITWLYTHKKQIVLPVVVTRDVREARLEHRSYTGEDALVRNRWGIEEPAMTDEVPVDNIDVVIVPALGVDRQGNRIGYGRGYYDRFLAQIDVPTICPVFRECLLDELPVEPHDVPVRIVVTEHEIARLRTS